VTFSEIAASFASSLFSVAVIAVPAFLLFARWIGSRLTKVTDAYGEERAKLLAQSHNIERLIEQTKALAATTEGIKTQLSAEEWGRQQRWLKRLEYYGNVMDAFHNYQNAATMFSARVQIIQEAKNKGQEISPRMLQIRDERSANHTEAMTGLLYILRISALVAPRDVVDILSDTKLPTPDGDIAEALNHSTELASTVMFRFVQAARADLGYESFGGACVQQVRLAPLVAQ